MCIQGLLLALNGLSIMDTLCIYLSILKFYVKHLPSILWPYYKFIQTVLLLYLLVFIILQ